MRLPTRRTAARRGPPDTRGELKPLDRVTARHHRALIPRRTQLTRAPPRAEVFLHQLHPSATLGALEGRGRSLCIDAHHATVAPRGDGSMAKRPCPGPSGSGCLTGSLVAKGTPRCPGCSTTYEQQRGSSTARGYGSRHKRLRSEWQARIDSGKNVYCWRCKTKRITGTHWHLGHNDTDRRMYMGPECVPCNTATSGRR
jgi:hypothetical protein